MTITHHLKIEIKTTDAYLRKFNLFKERFAAAITEFPDQFVFDKPDLAAAIDVAKASGLDYRVFHRFVPDDVDEFPAYKLTMPLVQPRSIGSRAFSIALEQPSLKIVASRAVKELFDAAAPHLTWEPHEVAERFVLAGGEATHHPITVEQPRIRLKNRKPKGTFTVIGNGIEILAAEDAARLRELSVLSYRTVTADNQTLPVPTTYIVGPQLRGELTQQGVLTDFVFPMFGAGQQEIIASLAL